MNRKRYSLICLCIAAGISIYSCFCVLAADDTDCMDYGIYNVAWSEDNDYLLAKIAMAEAGGENKEGKALVIAVVLNRTMDSSFPDTVKKVIYEKGQFSPIVDGRFDSLEPDSECWEALDLIRETETDISGGALYFENSQNTDNWHSRHLEFLFQSGNHRFYK